ncbi:hypothetical protein [Stenotrophomonas maltophilia]|uniref:hypothetical protein n=1 Tax=Stenotrophomonas maltophilia TaxID=40324 RepID=UPI00405451A2
MEVRSKLVGQGDATLVAVIAFVMGAGLSAGLATGGAFPFACVERGNLADWVAATGTWVIGYGAWKYAREAHKLRNSEVKDAASKGRRRVGAMKRLMQLRANALSAPANALDEFLKSPPQSPYPVAILVGNAQANLQFMKLVSWPDEHRLLLSEDGAHKLMVLELATIQFAKFAEQFVKENKGYAGPFSESETPSFAFMRTAAVTLRGAARDLGKSIKEIPVEDGVQVEVL